jgi:asparagine synthase (glutamine-hydrolysing)
MCGILGTFSPHSSPDQDQRLHSAIAALHHRGPDDLGLEAFGVAGGRLTLGHTRLSIIDLSPGGHQPMQSPDGRYTIVFNGEIYNYRELRQELKAQGHAFHTDSDTEVLLAAWAQWGAEGLRRLTGMFAFAVFDHVAQTLTLVRDAFGIKPLFYRIEGDALYFSSEIPALLKLLSTKPELNLQRAYNYLVWGQYDNGSDTFYQGIHHLLPGHWLKIDLQRLVIDRPTDQSVRWWWPSIEERTDLSFEDAAAQLREMFLNNVRLHLRSDVPVGAALSGGVDSSAVVCAMRHLEPDMPIHTFSFVARGSSVDEEAWVDIVNTHVGATAHKIVVAPEELAQDLDDMIRVQGEPFGGTSIYAQYRVFKAAREAGVVVTLDGQGADELLAGYNGYPRGYLRSLLEKHSYLAIPVFLSAWAKWPGRGWKRALRMLGAALMPLHLRALARHVIGNDPEPSWLNSNYLQKNGATAVFPAAPADMADGKQRRLVEQLRFALTGNGLASLLRHGDRNAMRWSIESRVPFLTTEMAEFLLTLPESYLLSPKGETKHIFRAAMRGIVPDEILDRRDKIGFETPEHAWLRPRRDAIQNWLATADELPFLYGARCHKEVAQILDGQKPFSQRAWGLINYCRWEQVL